MACNQSQNGQEEGQELEPEAAGIVDRGSQDGFTADLCLCGGMLGILLCLLLGGEDGDGLQLLALRAQTLVLLNLLLVAIDEVVVADVTISGLSSL